MPTVTRLTSNGVFQSSGGFDEVSLNSGSIRFNGSSYLNIAANTNLQIAGSPFTMEAWVYPTSRAGNEKIISAQDTGTSNGTQYQFRLTTSGNLQYIYWTTSSRGSATTVTTSNTVPLNQWSHVVACYDGTTLRLFVNGTSGFSGAVTMYSNAFATGIGGYSDPAAGDFANYAFIGYISNFRILKGTALYTSNFIPLTSPLTTIANTALLLNVNAQNSFKDSSNNNFALTKVGTPTFNTLGPFYYPGNTSINLTNTNNTPNIGTNTNIITSTTSNGVVMISNGFDEVSMSSGSLYFDGAGDSLTVPSSEAFAFGTGDYTMECWVYPQNSGSDFFSGTSDLCNFGYTGGQFFFYTGTLNNFVALVLNQWNHIAASRVSGTLNCYLNGVKGFTGSQATNFSNQSIVIGINQSGSGGSLLGFLSNIRIVKGTALYTANFTPPQTALLPVANTSLLLNNFAAEPFVDNSPNNFTFTRNGTPSANTLSPFTNTQQKVLNTGTMMTKEYDELSFTSQSIRFNGTTGYLTIPSNESLNLSTGNFTIEALVYWNGFQNAGTILDKDGQFGSAYPGYDLSLNGSGYVRFNVGAGNSTSYNQVITSSIPLPSNTWIHIAGVKSGTKLTLYQNGANVASATQFGTINNGGRPVYIGYQNGQALASYFGGNISNIRILKGTALYTANFAPPQMALSAVANTVLLLNNFAAQPFVDNSSNNNTITITGGVTANTLSPFA